MLPQAFLEAARLRLTDDGDITFVDAKPKRYDPGEPRKPKGDPEGGEWTSGVSPIYGSGVKPAKGAITGDDPTRLDNLPPEYRAQLVARLQTVFPDATPEQLAANLDAELAKGLANPKAAEGLQWYGKAHAVAAQIAEENGFTQSEATSALASMSPQQEWGSNVVTAQFVGKAIKANAPVNLTPAESAKVMTELKGTGSGTYDAGKLLSTYPPREAGSIAKALGQRDGGLSYQTDEGRTAHATWSCGLNGIENAVRSYRGEDPDVLLGGHKVRSFYNNIARPGDSHGAVTIDTHAISAALGIKVPSQDERMGQIMGSPSNRQYSTKGTYAVFADAYRAVAAKYDLSPEQAQAVIWLEWRQEHP